MPQEPQTPGSVRRSPRRKDTSKSAASRSTTDSSIPDSKNSKDSSKDTVLSKSVQDIRLTLEENEMYIGKLSVFEKNEVIFKPVQYMVEKVRGSEMKIESIEKFIETNERWVTANEISLIRYLGPVLLKDYRMVKAKQTMQLENDQGNVDWMIRSWDKDGMDVNLDVLFKHMNIPPGLTIPKPDQVYGMHLDAFDKSEKEVNKRYFWLAGISPRIWHPFLIFEWKGSGGVFGQALNQACHAGAAIVKANRELRSLAGTLANDAKGPDTSSYVFSCTICPDLAKIWVHWCLDGGDSPQYHMSKVSNHPLDESKDIKSLRRNLDNILDWGVWTRAQEVKALLATIRENNPEIFGKNDSQPKKRR